MKPAGVAAAGICGLRRMVNYSPEKRGKFTLFSTNSSFWSLPNKAFCPFWVPHTLRDPRPVPIQALNSSKAFCRLTCLHFSCELLMLSAHWPYQEFSLLWPLGTAFRQGTLCLIRQEAIQGTHTTSLPLWTSSFILPRLQHKIHSPRRFICEETSLGTTYLFVCSWDNMWDTQTFLLCLGFCLRPHPFHVSTPCITTLPGAALYVPCYHSGIT